MVFADKVRRKTRDHRLCLGKSGGKALGFLKDAVDLPVRMAGGEIDFGRYSCCLHCGTRLVPAHLGQTVLTLYDIGVTGNAAPGDCDDAVSYGDRVDP